MPPRYLHLDLPKHVMRNVGRFRFRAHTLAVELATVTSVPVLLFKMRCMFFFTVKTCLRALPEESTLSFSSLSAFSMEALYIPHALPSQTVFDSLSRRHNRLCHFILDTMDYFFG